MQSRILIVDDNPKNIQVLANHLTNDDYEVEFASNGKQAVTMIEQEDFDLILLDVMMPGIDGFETCKRIKKLENKKHIPIIFVTAKTDMDSLTLGFEYGGVDYISKPFKADELLLRVSTHIELKKTRDKLNYHKTSLEKKEAFYNDKINTMHREFMFKTKDLENTIKMQSQLVGMFSDFYNDSINSLATPVSLLKLETLDKKATDIVNNIENIITKNDVEIKFFEKYKDYFVLRESALKRENVSLEKIIGDSLSKFTKEIKSKKLEISTDLVAGILINSDKQAMTEIVQLMINNSIIHCDISGSIEIKTFEDQGKTVLQISDNGKGFEKDTLLYPFRIINKDGEIFGTKLFFAKYICDLHGYILKLNNNNPRGAVVRIVF